MKTVSSKIALIGGASIIVLGSVLSWLTLSELKRSSIDRLQWLSEGLTYPIYHDFVSGLMWGTPIEDNARDQGSALSTLIPRQTSITSALRTTGITDSSGKILAHNDPTEIGKWLLEESARKVFSTRESRVLATAESYFTLIPVVYEDQLKAHIFAGFDRESIDAPIRVSMLKAAAVSILITTLAVILFVLVAQKYVLRRITRMARAVREIETQETIHAKIPAEGNDEIFGLAKDINELLESLRRAQLQSIESTKSLAQIEVARQVAHDIRSPLSVLKVATENLSRIDDAARNLIHAATARIEQIAGDLEERDRAKGKGLVYVPTTLETLIGEKRAQFRDRPRVSITLRKEGLNPLDAYILAPKEVFFRVLSNIIDNSFEAIPDEGKITVCLVCEERKLYLRIRDDGCGISPEVLPRLMKKGATFSKTKGSGLGLYYAKTNVENWNGSISIQSELGRGTEVLITLPLVAAPKSLVSSIDVSGCDSIVCVDDDPAVLRMWKQRLGDLGKKVQTFNQAKDFRSWMRSRPSNGKWLYLVDFEFPRERTSGLDLIREFSIQEDSIMVTGLYDIEKIQVRCDQLGIRLAPKVMLNQLGLTT